jgi:hypothetical protein
MESSSSTLKVNKWINPLEDPEEFNQFGKFLEENFAGANSKNLCLQCWCLCNRYQMSKHKEQKHRILTPKLYKDLEAFKSLADQVGKYKDILIANPSINGPSTIRIYERITAHTDFMHSTSVKHLS